MSEAIESSVRIISVAPDTSKSLKVGEKVDVEVLVEYQISRSPAEIALIIQKGGLTNEKINSISGIKDATEKVKQFLLFIISKKSEVILEKKGRLILKDSFQVPETNSIHIFTPIMLQGDQTTEIVDTRFYKVI